MTTTTGRAQHGGARPHTHTGPYNRPTDAPESSHHEREPGAWLPLAPSPGFSRPGRWLPGLDYYEGGEEHRGH